MLGESKDAAQKHAVDMAAACLVPVLNFINDQSARVNDKYKALFIRQAIANIIATTHARTFSKFNSAEKADEFLTDLMVSVSQLLSVYKGREYVIAIRVNGEEQTWPPSES